jgi:hypothetical protein
MIEVAGVWEQGWNYALMEAAEWEMMLREFGVDTLNMTPVSGIAAPWGSKPWLTEYDSIDDVIAAKSNLTPVFVDESATTELQDLVHPDDALYIFGRAGFAPTIPDGAVSVKIATPCPGCLWAHEACAIVLYDRHRKQ